MLNRRKAKREPISYPIIYMVSDSNGQAVTQGLGIALDISMDGMMFESNEPIEETKLYIRASSHDGGSMKVMGILVYSMPYSDGKYRSGIRFKGAADQVSYFVTELLSRPS